MGEAFAKPTADFLHMLIKLCFWEDPCMMFKRSDLLHGNSPEFASRVSPLSLECDFLTSPGLPAAPCCRFLKGVPFTVSQPP